jgi:hypothetical protein
MTGEEIIAELERLGIRPADSVFADIDRSARWREEGVFLYVGSPIRDAVILGARCEILPRIAWVERKWKKRRLTKVSFAPLSYAWHGGETGTEYYVVITPPPRVKA